MPDDHPYSAADLPIAVGLVAFLALMTLGLPALAHFILVNVI